MTAIGAPASSWSQPRAGYQPTRGNWVRLTRRGRILLIVLLGTLLITLTLGVVGQMIAAGGAGGPGSPGAGAAVPDEQVLTVVVEQGDSLWAIAEMTAPGVDPRRLIDRIKDRNGLESNVLQPGQVLLVPTGG